LIGSTVGLTNGTGNYVNRYAYRPFGENLITTEGVGNSFEYVGQWGVMDEASGLDFMRARYYSPLNGRFTSVDPIGLNGEDTNFYRYVNNQPTAAVDPSGTILWWLLGAGIYAGIAWSLMPISGGKIGWSDVARSGLSFPGSFGAGIVFDGLTDALEKIPRPNNAPLWPKTPDKWPNWLPTPSGLPWIPWADFDLPRTPSDAANETQDGQSKAKATVSPLVY
jgi:RHS repeat-associated protein